MGGLGRGAAGAVRAAALAGAPAAAGKGTDVYFFLAGMMLLAEVARTEGLFDWVAALAVRRSRGAPSGSSCSSTSWASWSRLSCPTTQPPWC